MSLTQDMLPWDFGKIYVEEHFSEQSKQDVEAIIEESLQNMSRSSIVRNG